MQSMLLFYYTRQCTIKFGTNVLWLIIKMLYLVIQSISSYELRFNYENLKPVALMIANKFRNSHLCGANVAAAVFLIQMQQAQSVSNLFQSEMRSIL